MVCTEFQPDPGTLAPQGHVNRVLGEDWQIRCHPGHRTSRQRPLFSLPSANPGSMGRGNRHPACYKMTSVPGLTLLLTGGVIQGQPFIIQHHFVCLSSGLGGVDEIMNVKVLLSVVF